MADIRYTGVNPVVTRQAMEFFQTDTQFVAVKDVPLIRVPAPAGLLAVIDQDLINRDDVAQRSAQHTEAEKSSLAFTNVNYATDDRALEFDLSAKIASQIQAEIGTNPSLTIPRVLALKANIHTEGRLSLLWGAGSWFRTVTGAAADNAGTPTAKNRVFWSDLTKDPIAAIRQEVDIFLLRTGKMPTNFRMGRTLFTQVATHPLVRAQVALMVGGANAVAGMTMIASEAQLSQLIGMRVSVSSGIKNTAKESEAASNAFIITPTDALMTFDTPGAFDASVDPEGGPPVVDLGAPTGFARVAYTGVAANGMQVRSFPRPEIGAGGSQAWVLDLFQGFVIVNNKFGTFFSVMHQ